MITRNLLATVSVLAFALGACADTEVTSPDVTPSFGVAAGKTKVSVCHVSDEGSVHLITVGQPAVPAHQAHGDALPGDALAGNAGWVGDDCVSYAVVLNTAATFTSAHFGGGGGGPFVSACPAGSVGVGLAGTAGGWTFGPGGLWDVGIECQSLLGDGTLGGAPFKVGGAGSGTSGYAPSPFVGICGGGEILSEVSANFPGYVINGLGGGCSTVARLLAATGGSDSSIGPWLGVPPHGATVGGACPAGYAVTSVTGRSGWVVDAVGFECTQVIAQPI